MSPYQMQLLVKCITTLIAFVVTVILMHFSVQMSPFLAFVSGAFCGGLLDPRFPRKDVAQLNAELKAARALNLTLSKRVFAQYELLTRQAERKDV